MDNDMKVQEPVNVIYQTAEDGLADTVKPRLELAGADCEKILVIDESDKSLSMADERLEAALVRTGAQVTVEEAVEKARAEGATIQRDNETLSTSNQQLRVENTSLEIKKVELRTDNRHLEQQQLQLQTDNSELEMKQRVL